MNDWINLRKLKTNAGISLTEIIVTIVILGGLAGLAIPNYTTTVERSRSSEGVQILEALLAAQRLYKYENTVYSAVAADLDVQFPTVTHFDPPAVDVGTPTPLAGYIAQVDRDTGDYTLEINEIGKIRCVNDSPAYSICKKLGFSATF